VSTLALKGGPKAKTKPFPPWPQYGHEEEDSLQQVLTSRIWWRTPGTQTLEFERAFAEFQQTRYGIAVTNGTHALEVALCALGVKAGDEVIVPDFTFVATASAVLSVGALPILVDVEDGSYCLDPERVQAALTDRTRAIIAVHMGGHPADLDRLVPLAAQHGVHLVEDCAHAHGSEWSGKRVGSFGTAGTFSFQASKLMTAGEGGIIVSNDPEFERRARSVHDCGRLPGEWFYDHFFYGSNYRLSEWQGAILRAQLERLKSQREVRFANARRLNQALSCIEGIVPQTLDERCTHNGHYAYIFHYDRRAFQDLSTKGFIEALKAEGIPEQASYPPIHSLGLFSGDAYRERLSAVGACAERRMKETLSRPFPVTEKAAWETVWIPHFALLGDQEDMEEIAAAIRKIQSAAGELAELEKRQEAVPGNR
jgi:dTDP-4-amino-4,6-dideoxygalactose transaminase